MAGGAAGLVVAPQSWGLLAALVIYQHSFAAAFGRDEVSLLTFQPIVTYNLQQGFYLRSSGIWTFDLVHAVPFIPLGFGIGKVVKFGDKITMNAFVEPQYSIAKSGVGRLAGRFLAE